MSAINYTYTRPRVNFESEIHSFAVPANEYSYYDDFCIGQDAGFILRKRAMIVDLWNLVPEVEKTSFDSSMFFDLPVIYNNGMENTHSFDKQIPIQQFCAFFTILLFDSVIFVTY